MSLGFGGGFSASDFTAAIELVGTVADALRSSGESAAEYRELVSQLLSLESALIQVKRLEIEEGQYEEVAALRQAALLCQTTIDTFWQMLQKYQPVLGGSGSSLTARERWMKVKWAICKREDVAKFREDLLRHTDNIQLMLTTLQM